MPKDIHVLLIEDDPYARDLMGLLFTRDWRTRIVAEVGSESDLEQVLQEDTFHRIDAVVLDTEVPEDPEWPFRVAKYAHNLKQPPAILCTATKPNLETLKRLVQGGFNGYVLKREIGYSLAAVVSNMVKQSQWIVTPTIYKRALQMRVSLPDGFVVVDGTKPVAALTPREEEIARLAILFNHAHRDLADELLIRADQVSKHVSNIYTKLGLEEILTAEIEPDVFIQDKLVLKHFERILDRVATSKSKRKTADMATLAFHLLTVPDVNQNP